MRRWRTIAEEIQQLAGAARRSPTPSEARLWEVLRRRQLDGLHFRRQHAIGRFILDFYCPAGKLAVEIDGGIHAERRERDAERDAILETHGIKTLRVTDEQVMESLPDVLDAIRRAYLGVDQV